MSHITHPSECVISHTHQTCIYSPRASIERALAPSFQFRPDAGLQVRLCVCHTHTRTHVHTHAHTLFISLFHSLSLHIHKHTMTHVCTHSHTYMYSLSHTHIHTYTHAHLRTHKHVRTHTHTRTHVHIATSPYAQPCVRGCVCV